MATPEKKVAPITTAPSAKKERKPRQKRDPNAPKESREDRFRRIAGKRLPRAIYSVTRLEALGGSAYASTPEQREKVVTMLYEAVQAVEKGLNRVSASKIDPRKPIEL